MDDETSRRVFLKGAAALGSALVLTPAIPPTDAAEISGAMPWQPNTGDFPAPVTTEGFVFFKPNEVAFLDAAISRLIPQDEHGPGAKELGVTTFLDRQMAGSYGRAERWYMSGPFDDRAAPEFGYQLHSTPAQFYQEAIKAIEIYLSNTPPNKPFDQLSPQDQDKILTALETGQIKLDGVRAEDFFTLLLQNTIEGYFGDPLYGGNKDMAAWKMIGFPGARYDYRSYVEKHNQRIVLDPVGVGGGKPFQSSNG